MKNPAKRLRDQLGLALPTRVRVEGTEAREAGVSQRYGLEYRGLEFGCRETDPPAQPPIADTRRTRDAMKTQPGVRSDPRARSWRPWITKLRILAVPLAFSFASFNETAGQHPTLDPGIRLRVSAKDHGINGLIGPFSRVNPDTIMVGSMPLAIDWVTRVETSRGRGTYVARGLGVGFLVGGVVGAGIPAAACWPCDREYDILGPVAGGVAGSLLGLLIGGLYGYSKKREFWKEIPKESLRISVGPQSGGRVGFGLSVLTGGIDR